MKLTSDYIVGLVDGEGSFTVYVRNPETESNRIRRVLVEPRFYIKLIGKDKVVLDALKVYFKCGNVYFQKDSRQNHQDCYRYEVGKRSDLVEKIIPFFEKHQLLFPSKANDFRIFCRMMKLIESKAHLEPIGLRSLYALKQTMH